MARPPLPRFRADVVLVVEVAARDEADADRIVAGIANLLAERAASTVRNLDSRTHRVIVDGTSTTEASVV